MLRMRLYPGHQRCREVLHHNKAGRPVRCGKPGYVRLTLEGKAICRRHFEDMRPELERKYV